MENSAEETYHNPDQRDPILADPEVNKRDTISVVFGGELLVRVPKYQFFRS